MTDAFGYTSTAQYDVRFGVATTETDINQAQLHAHARRLRPHRDRERALRHATARADDAVLPRGGQPRGGDRDAPVGARRLQRGRCRQRRPRSRSRTASAARSSRAKTAVVNAVAGMTINGAGRARRVGRVIRRRIRCSQRVRARRSSRHSDAHDRDRVRRRSIVRVLTTYADGASECASFDVTTNPDGMLLFLSRIRSIRTGTRARPSSTTSAARGRSSSTRARPASSVTRYDYLGTGELAHITDAEGNQTSLALRPDAGCARR